MPSRLTTSQFVDKAREVHGEVYDYSEVNYKNAKTKVSIICLEHGCFSQTPDSHLHGSGCPECGKGIAASANRYSSSVFIKKARLVHGQRYDYSRIEYERSNKKITIVCAEHGPFEQIPASHLQGMGCGKCGRIEQGRSRRLTTQTFVERANEVHGQKYDYEKVRYVTSQRPVEINCPEHGMFLQSPSNHLSGRNCPRCANLLRGEKKRLSRNDFLRAARQVHGDHYDYSRFDYKGMNKKGRVDCIEHGAFHQTANNHIYSGKGCPKCAAAARGLSKRLSQRDFIRRANAIHKGIYEYTKTHYVTGRKKILIRCSDHGEFTQWPEAHLAGQGCPKCGKERSADAKRDSAETFAAKAREIHGSKYDYSQVDYQNALTSVSIVCPEHGVFKQKPNDHLSQQSGCPRCARYGFDSTRPALLYYVGIEDRVIGRLYKIGITNRTVEERFKDDWHKIEIIRVWPFESGRKAKDAENSILREHADDRYNGPPLLLAGGDSEIFVRDVLDLDSR